MFVLDLRILGIARGGGGVRELKSGKKREQRLLAIERALGGSERPLFLVHLRDRDWLRICHSIRSECMQGRELGCLIPFQAI